MKLFHKQISFTSSLKSRAAVALILGTFLSILIILLEPFDTNEFESEYRVLLLLGFGVILSLVCFGLSLVESYWYSYKKKHWTVGNEMLSVLIFFIVSGTFIYLYNRILINDSEYSIQSHWWYFSHIVFAMIPVVAPLLIYLRQRFGERIISVSPSMLVLIGENKSERMEVPKDRLLFVQAIENYIDIHYLDDQNRHCSKTFRQTLTNAHQQASFLEKSHRSYLVNASMISSIKGNSQNAKICFENFEKEVPLSKSQYKLLRAKVSLPS